MKNHVILAMLILVAACGVDSSMESYDSIVILPDNKFQVGTQTADLSTSVKALGKPSDRQITISACPGAPLESFGVLIDALEAAGYKRIAHTTDYNPCASK